jgi:hypothetical protein
VYFGFVIDGEELKIDLEKLEAIIKWKIPTIVIEVGSFVGATWYLQKFISSFSTIASSFHDIIISGKSFMWGNCYRTNCRLVKSHPNPQDGENYVRVYPLSP